MDNKRSVVLATAHRSEHGILEPVIARLEKKRANGEIDFHIFEQGLAGWQPWDLHPDVILIPADRKEMALLAAECFYQRIPIFHLWAGIGKTGTWDDVNRRVISSYSYLMLCEDIQSKKRLVSWGEDPWRCLVVGTTHFDDLVVDESKVPDVPYDLVLVKPNPVDPADEARSWTQVFELVDKKIVEVGSAEGSEMRHPALPRMAYYDSLPRPQFLGLLKNCERFISNSSAVTYEAPYFGVHTVNPGRRNMRRKASFEMKPGASDRIVDILANHPITPEKLLKVYR